MKARQENGEIKVYKRLPRTYTKADGSIVLNFFNADIETLEAEGFYDLIVPEYDPRVEQLDTISWNEDDSVFEYSKIDTTISESLAELKTQKKQAVKDLANLELQKTDWYITRNAELDTAIPTEIQTERSSVRTKVTERENEIDALTTKKAVIKWIPVLFDPPIDEPV